MRTPILQAGIFKDGTKGFTLIELVMVIAIISVIAAIVLPRLDPFVPERRLKSAARRLSGTITLAYGESISRNKTYRLYLDPSKDTYWVVEIKQREETGDSGGTIGITLGTNFELLRYQETDADAEHVSPGEPLFAPQKLPQGVHLASMKFGSDMTGLQYIEFSPLGVASPATINLVNEDGEALTVQYDGVTGTPSLIASTPGM